MCQYCGRDYRVPVPAGPKPKSVLSIIGGVLLVVAGLLGLAMGALIMSISLTDLENYVGTDLSMVEDIIRTCGIIVLVLGLITMLGGVFGVMRKHWGLAVLGGVVGLLLVLTPWFLGSILALIGLVLVLVSKSDFD